MFTVGSLTCQERKTLVVPNKIAIRRRLSFGHHYELSFAQVQTEQFHFIIVYLFLCGMYRLRSFVHVEDV